MNAQIKDPTAMSKGKKNLFVFAVMMLYAGFASSSYGIGVVAPAKLAMVDGMEYYSLVSAIGGLGMVLALPLVGKLCDTFGTKAVVITGLIIQAAFRVGLMYADNWQMILVWNIGTSVGLSLYLSAPFAMLSEVFEPKDRPKFFGMLVAFKAIGSFVGPIITGAMMDATLVNLAFLSYIPFMIIATPFILALYPNVKTNRMQGKKFDLAGIILVVVCVSCIIFFLTLGGKLFEWLSPQGLVLLFIGIVSLFLLIRIETRHENPSVAIYLFKKKRFLAAFLCAFCLSVFGVAIAAYGYVYTQQIMQVSATVSSTTTIPMTIAQVLFGFVIGRYFSKRFISRFRGAALISIVLTIAAVGGLCFLTPDSSMILIYVVSLLGGVGSVVPQSAFANFFQTELQPQEIAAAQGLFTFGSTIGPTIFMAISGAMLNAGLNYINVFMLAVVFCVVGLVIGIVGLKFPKDMVLADKSDKQAE